MLDITIRTLKKLLHLCFVSLLLVHPTEEYIYAVIIGT